MVVDELVVVLRAEDVDTITPPLLNVAFESVKVENTRIKLQLLGVIKACVSRTRS